jgi:acyl-CoA thioesterase-2
MSAALADLLKVMTLERLERDLFRGESRDIGSPQVYGGQVLGQALVAASSTVEQRVVHSLHAYFMRRGDFNQPIVYEVDRSRDGRHFSTRRVVAIQHGEQIFNMSASFQADELGLEHQASMPAVAPPESLPELASYYRDQPFHASRRARRVLEHHWPFDIRPVEPPNDIAPQKLEPVNHVWVRTQGSLPDDESLHRCLLAYVSDFTLLSTATNPHGLAFGSQGLIMASIDHAMWFHRPVRVDGWLLYVTDSPSSSGARGFTRGSIFSRDGRLVASTSQEGLMRLAAK